MCMCVCVCVWCVCVCVCVKEEDRMIAKNEQKRIDINIYKYFHRLRNL